MQELTWCTAAEDSAAPAINIEKKRTRRTTAQEGFQVMGAVVTFDNKLEVELKHRLTRADRVFWARWELLGCISIPFGDETRGVHRGGERDGVLVRWIVEPYTRTKRTYSH